MAPPRELAASIFPVRPSSRYTVPSVVQYTIRPVPSAAYISSGEDQLYDAVGSAQTSLPVFASSAASTPPEESGVQATGTNTRPVSPFLPRAIVP